MEILALIDNITECKIIEFGENTVTVSFEKKTTLMPYTRIFIPNIMVVMGGYINDTVMTNNFKKYLKLKHG